VVEVYAGEQRPVSGEFVGFYLDCGGLELTVPNPETGHLSGNPPIALESGYFR
jgi:hypothetical protein